jgi:hypothetical protein
MTAKQGRHREDTGDRGAPFAAAIDQGSPGFL